MSRGLGKKQKQFIEWGGATQTVLDAVHSISVDCGSLIPVDGYREGQGRDGIKRWYGNHSVTCPKYLKELIADRDYICEARSPGWDTTELKQLVQAAISCDDICTRLAPELFLQDHRKEEWCPDAGMYGVTQIRTSDAVKKGRNTVRVTVSRAFTSLAERGLVIKASGLYSLMSNDEGKAIYEQRGWQTKNTGVHSGIGQGTFYYVVDESALANTLPTFTHKVF